MTEIFLKVVEMSLTGAVVIAVIILLRLALRKAPKVFSYILWTAALFRLLCPMSFTLPVAPIPSLMLPNPESAYTEAAKNAMPSESAVVISENTEANEHVTADNNAVSSPEPKRINALDATAYLWAVCTAAMLLHGAVSWARLSHRLKNAQRISGNVYASAAVSDPFVMGIVRPKIYLPMGLSAAESELVIKHERTHIRRGDHIAKLVMYCALCIHFFDPFVWIMFRLFEQDMEMSCDEKVTADMTDGEKADYSQALLKLSGKPTAVFAACFGENSTKRRIKNILSFKKPAVWTAVVLAAAAVAVSVLLCADGRLQPSKNVLNDGKYYACGTDPNAYFIVKNGTIQLFGAGSSEPEKPTEYKLYDVSANDIRVTKILLQTDNSKGGKNDAEPQIAYLGENAIEYCGVKFARAKGTELDARSNDIFGAKAYLVQIGGEYKLDLTLTNLTEREVSADIAQYFGVFCIGSFTNPAARCTAESCAFAPYESKNFIFDVEDETGANTDAEKAVTGSCGLFIKSLGDEYLHFNVLILNTN